MQIVHDCKIPGNEKGYLGLKKIQIEHLFTIGMIMKALAQIYGSYHILEHGHPQSAMEMFTGKPSLFYKHSTFSS